MALGLNKTADAEKYLATSDYWINLYKADQTSAINISQQTNTPLEETGFTGFLQPRYLNGTFGYQDPSLCSLLTNFTSCYLKWVPFLFSNTIIQPYKITVLNHLF